MIIIPIVTGIILAGLLAGRCIVAVIYSIFGIK